jgi:hypothetical protein
LSIDTGAYRERDSIQSKIRARLLPRILDGKSEAFTLSGCSFKLSPSKASTMRVVMYHEMNITCAYTLEASFGGKDGVHYGVGELEEVGWEFAESLREFWRYLKDEDGAVTGVKRSLGSKEEGEKVGFDVDSDDEGCGVEVNESVRKYIEAEYIRVQRAEEEEMESAGSESDPSGDNMDEEERRRRMGRKKKGKKKSSKGKGKKKETEKTGGRGGLRLGSGGVGGNGVGVGGGRERVGSADSSSSNVLRIPVSEVYRKPKRPEGRKTRKSFENVASRTPRASITKEKADSNDQNVARPQRAMSAGGVGSMRMVKKRTVSSADVKGGARRGGKSDERGNVVDPRFVTVGGHGNESGRSVWMGLGGVGLGAGEGDARGGIEQAVKAGVGPRVGLAKGGRSFQGEGGKRKDKVKEEIRKVKKDLENHLEFNVTRMGGEGGGA